MVTIWAMPSPRNRRAHVDEHAADLIREFLDERGWSAFDLALQTGLVAKRHNRAELATSRRTIDRILSEGHVPRARTKAAICLVMSEYRPEGEPPIAPWHIWGRGQRPLAFQREQVLAGAAR